MPVGDSRTAAPAPRRLKKLIVAPRRQHSRKPDEAYARIEALCEGPYLELFARGARPGWDSWGREAGGEGSTIRPRRWVSNSYPDPPGPSAEAISTPSPGPFRSAR